MSFVVTSRGRLAAEQAYVKNRVAVVLGLLIQADFPALWPTAFDDLLSAVDGPDFAGIYLRVLVVVDEEVVQSTVNNEAENRVINQRIKDAMRSTGVVVRVADFWLKTLQTYRATVPDLCVLCLDTMQRFISWIDIGLVVNDL